MNGRRCLLLAVLLACSHHSPARAQDLPKPNAPVADSANAISTGFEQKLNGFLLELERKTSAQLWVVTVPTTDGVPIEQYSLALAENWGGKGKGIGQKGKDNGCLIVVAVADRKYRIEVGEGLEGALPDAYCGRVARAYFVPNFRQGNYGEGLYQAALDIAGRIAKEHGVEIADMPTFDRAQQTRSEIDETARRRRNGMIERAIPIIVVILILTARRRRRGYRGWAGPVLWTLMAGGGRSSRSSWGSSGGFGGFGGGFGGGSSFGGGGGRFGGGGASGGW